MKKITLLLSASLLALNSIAQINNEALDNIFGKKGMVTGNVYKIGYPRSDLKVKVGDFAVSPGLALGTWVGIMNMGNHAMMMGDLVLLDKEVPKVINKLVEQNLEVTAIHNHLINETPAIKYVHYYGEGNAMELAKKIKTVIEMTATPLTPSAKSQTPNIDWSSVMSILGTEGKQNGMLLQYTFPRNEKLLEGGIEMP